MSRDHGIDALRTRQPTILRQRLAVRTRRQWPFLLRHDEDLLAEEAHLTFAIALVEGDEISERSRWRLRAQPGEIRVQVCLELVEQDLELGVVELSFRRDVRRIDDR